jgi:hypothetical protein
VYVVKEWMVVGLLNTCSVCMFACVLELVSTLYNTYTHVHRTTPRLHYPYDKTPNGPSIPPACLRPKRSLREEREQQSIRAQLLLPGESAPPMPRPASAVIKHGRLAFSVHTGRWCQAMYKVGQPQSSATGLRDRIFGRAIISEGFRQCFASSCF